MLEKRRKVARPNHRLFLLGTAGSAAELESVIAATDNDARTFRNGA